MSQLSNSSHRDNRNGATASLHSNPREVQRKRGGFAQPVLSGALRTIALLEAAKGALVLLVGFGLLSLIHHDVQRFAQRLILHEHLNPAARYPHIFLSVASQLTDARLWLIVAGAAAYSLVRFVEAYGLWYSRRWAEWFAALSAGVYVPFELFELYEHVTWLSLGALILNLTIVALMLNCVFRADGAKL